MLKETTTTIPHYTAVPLKLQGLITLDFSSGCSSWALDPFINLLQQCRRQQAAGLHLATDWDQPYVWPESVALKRTWMWIRKSPKIKHLPFNLTTPYGEYSWAGLTTETGKQEQAWSGRSRVLDQSVLCSAVIQRVSADRDLTFDEMLSVGSKAVAGLPPWGLQMYFFFIFDEVGDIRKCWHDWKSDKLFYTLG